MRRSLCLIVILGVLGSASAAVASSYTGKLALGYVWLDETGNRSVNQPTFNLYEGMAAEGENVVKWDGRTSRGDKLPAGLYFYRFETRNFQATRKAILIR